MKNKLTLALVALLIAFGSPIVNGKKDKKDKPLPPGLEKKAEQGKPLPPGWQKKLKVGKRLDNDIYSHAKVVVPIGKDGILTVNIDGRLLRLRDKTREIIEILK